MSILGHLEDLPLPDVLQLMSMGKRCGVLTLISRVGSGRIFLNNGRVVYASSDVCKRLGYTLVEEGLVSFRELNEVLEQQRDSDDKRPLGTLLVERGLLTAEQLSDILKLHLLQIFAEFLTWKKGIFYFEKYWLLDRQMQCREGLSIERILLQAELNDESVREPEVEFLV